MLDVVSRIDEQRIVYRCAMAVLTRCCQGHITGGVMVDVMGIQVKGRTVIYIAVTLRTVAGGPAVLQCAVCVMAGGTVIVLDVVATINKGLTGGYCRCMTAVAVSNQCHITGAGMIDSMIGPGTAAVAVSTDRTAADTA